MKKIGLCVSLVFFILINCNSVNDMKPDTTPVKDFDLERYLGTWYEIARFPHSFEKNLVGVTATYSLREDGKVKVENQGYADSLDGKLKSITGKAKLAADPNTGYLKVSFFWFFYSDYKVLVLDKEHYQYALVGSSSANFLWILSRTPVLTNDTYNLLIEEARQRGYDTTRIEKVKQKPLKEPDIKTIL